MTGIFYGRTFAGDAKMRVAHWTTIAALSALLLLVRTADAAEVTLFSVGGVKQALDKIVADYTKETGNKVKYVVGSPLSVSKRLADGEIFDVVVQSAPAMDDYAKLGGVNVDTRVKVARGGIGMAIRKDAVSPDISTPDAFKRALLEAKSIAMTNTAMPNGSGVLTQIIFKNAGVMDAIKPKIKVVDLDPGQQQIAKGAIEIGLFNISEIRPFVKLAGPVPGSLQQYTNYDAAVTTKSTATQAAAALVRMIASPTSAEHWKSAGMEPAH
jgi:molybdate transport system substrate-binding protein